ncbi:MAG: hypothetical protein E6G01_11440 [Actinobacteria bacterium]|nr:MAG: hypothetical protein E6G01_11440 [Actinomycetota bacterium]
MASDRPKGVRATITRGIVRVPFLRRLYVRRMLKFLERSKRKKRALPKELAELDIAMSKVPKDRRMAMLESALTEGAQGGASRQMRRAADRQKRQSGRGGPRRRPGAVKQGGAGPAGPPPGGQQTRRR